MTCRAVAAVVLTLLAAGCDTLRFHNGSGQPIGVLIDAAATGGGAIHDRTVITTTTSASFDNVTSAEVQRFKGSKVQRSIGFL